LQTEGTPHMGIRTALVTALDHLLGVMRGPEA